MILGKIIGKVTTKNFTFLVTGPAKKFEYIQVLHKENYYVLSQIIEIEKDINQATAYCNIIGYKESNAIKQLKTPLEPETEALKAEDSFIKEILSLEQQQNSAFIGHLNGKDIKVYLNINKLLTKHIAILAKSGSGKSWTSAVLIEELLDKNVPILIIDPHGEYSSLKYPADNTAKGYIKQIKEFSPDTAINPEAKPLRLSANLNPSELIHLLPARLSNAQLNCLYSAIKNIDNLDFDQLILALQNEDSNLKWNLINIIEYIKGLNLFSNSPTTPFELIQPGIASIVNLKGIPVEIQEVVVYKLSLDLFNERRKNNIPPFFFVIEEAHNYIPERNYGEAKSSSILRQLASEGRKFGLGLCLVTQRPSRIEKNALSQITTQIILKVTNPNDLKAISNSVEGITSETEKEIRNLPIGTALITGVVDLPIFVDIRPRRTKHGGQAIEIITEKETNIEKEIESFKTKNLLPVIEPKISLQDLKLINKNKEIKTVLIPCLYLSCQNHEAFNILINLNKSELILNVENLETLPLQLPNLNLSPQQNKILQLASTFQEFKPAELFPKSGLQFSEVYDIITALNNKGILTKVNDKYKLNEKLSIFSNLDKYPIYEKVDFKEVNYDLELDKNINPVIITSLISKFIKIVNEKECFLIHHKLI